MAYNLTLVGSSSFISASGKIYQKGIVYSVSEEEALALLSSKDDYEVPFFSKSADSAPAEVAESVPESPVPSTEDVAKSMNDPAPSNSSDDQGEVDTATAPRRPGRPGRVAV